jgi:hypothetical protein
MVVTGLSKALLGVPSVMILSLIWAYFAGKLLTSTMYRYKRFQRLCTNSLRLFFPGIFNPARRADSCVHRNTARCVLSCWKLIPLLKTLALAGGWKTSPESKFI